MSIANMCIKLHDKEIAQAKTLGIDMSHLGEGY